MTHPVVHNTNFTTNVARLIEICSASEANEVFFLRLTTSQATLGDAEGQALIVNDDSRR